jgi:hypothetical protein
MKKMTTEEMVKYLVDNGIATQEEVELVCDINGYSKQTMRDILYSRTGYDYFDQID